MIDGLMFLCCWRSKLPRKRCCSAKGRQQQRDKWRLVVQDANVQPPPVLRIVCIKQLIRPKTLLDFLHHQLPPPPPPPSSILPKANPTLIYDLGANHWACHVTGTTRLLGLIYGRHDGIMTGLVRRAASERAAFTDSKSWFSCSQISLRTTGRRADPESAPAGGLASPHRFLRRHHHLDGPLRLAESIGGGK